MYVYAVVQTTGPQQIPRNDNMFRDHVQFAHVWGAVNVSFSGKNSKNGCDGFLDR